MMGERLAMQESLFYAFRLEDHVPPVICYGALTGSSTAPSCVSIWPVSTAPRDGPRSTRN
jgi:hypothetical protein